MKTLAMKVRKIATDIMAISTTKLTLSILLKMRLALLGAEFHDIINEMCNDDTLLKQRTTQVDGLTGKRVWCYRLSS